MRLQDRGHGCHVRLSGDVPPPHRRRPLRGTDEHLPCSEDKRFPDPAWSLDRVYRRLSQTCRAAGGAASRLVDERYRVGGVAGPGAAAWREGAERRTGSWWGARSAWVLERAGETTGAPAGLGSERHPPLEPAPGAYALGREPVSERVYSGPAGRRP